MVKSQVHTLVNNTGARVNVSGSGYTYASILLKNGYLFENPDLTNHSLLMQMHLVMLKSSFHQNKVVMVQMQSLMLAKRIMANIRLTYAEGQGDFPVDNDFRRIGIIKNPKLPAPSTDFATQETISAVYALKLNNVSGSFSPDEVVEQELCLLVSLLEALLFLGFGMKWQQVKPQLQAH